MSEVPIICGYCGRQFDMTHRRHGRFGTALSEHYIDCPERRVLKEAERRADIARETGRTG